jgi:primosomal protein N' (replication factor Y)
MAADGTRWVEVAVERPVLGTFTYELPGDVAARVCVGARVRVPFGAQGAVGYVTALRDQPPPAGVEAKPVRELLGDAPLDAELVRFLTWAADYYLAPPGEMIRAALPSGTQAELCEQVRLLAPAAQGRTARERAVLDALRAHGGGPIGKDKLERELGKIGPVIARLGERGLVERAASVASPRVRVRHESVYSLVRPPTPAERAALTRAPRRLAVLDRLEAAGGAPVPLSALREVPRSAVHAAALVAAGLAARSEREVVRDPFAGEPPPPHPAPTLHARQADAVAQIESALANGAFAPFLLYGVTGSGKTEIYLRAIAAARRQGKGAIVLVPEISLTPQLAARFRARFGDDVAVLHSGLQPGERFDAWRRLRSGQVGIALGARSAVFAPVMRLGIIVVDEEHDGSFKQEEGVRYHARDLALVRARQVEAVCVLGSATPSLESFHGATRQARSRLLELPDRATARPLPRVQVVDLRVHRPDKDGLLSAPLCDALSEVVAAGEQAILFLNRRGFATFLLCKACGHGLRCRDCSVTLTLHRARGVVVCHYCGATARRPTQCPQCKAENIAELGVGTERVEAALRERFPEARVARLDRDTGAGAGLRKLLSAMARREIDLLVGTQMVTKGHDFPGVTLVGVVLADTGLHLPDFRAAERSFQLLTQVAGRAGRGDQPGRVIVQTYDPQHPAVACSAQHDYAGFVERELGAREELGYPPFGRLVAVRIDGPDENIVRQQAEELALLARQTASRLPSGAPTVLGPAEAPIARIRGRTRWQITLRGTDRAGLRKVAWHLLRHAKTNRDVRVGVDVDPVSAL